MPFSDGVLAIITIMVLEIKVPHGDDFAVISPLLPVLLSYDLPGVAGAKRAEKLLLKR